MGKKLAHCRQTACVLLLILLMGVSAQSVNAQFVNRGDAWIGIQDAAATPVQILPEDIDALQGYVLGDVATPGYKDISIVKGSVPKGNYWQNLYHVKERSLYAVKMLQIKDRLFVLFNVMHGQYPTQLYAGIAEFDANDGHIIQAKKLITSPDDRFEGPKFAATDLVNIEDRLVVSGYTDELAANGYTHIQTGYLVFLDLGLNETYAARLFHEKGSDIMPLELATDGKQLMTLSRFTVADKSPVPHTAISVSVYDLGAGLNQVAERAYIIPYRLRAAHIAYNPYNKELVLSFQQLMGPDFSWTFTLMSLETANLATINQSVYNTYVLFNTRINIDGKYITLAGSNNVFDAGVYNGVVAQFYHDTHNESAVTNPYSTSTMGESQAYFQDGSVSLLLTAMPDRISWIYGYGPEEKCEILERELLPETDELYQETGGMYTKEDKIGCEYLDMEAQKFETDYKTVCGKVFDFVKRTVASLISNRDQAGSQLLIADQEKQLTVTCNDEMQQVKMYNMAGQLVFNQKSNSATCVIPKEHLSKGVYIISVLSGSRVMNQKVYIQ